MAGAVLGEGQVSLFVVGAVLGEVQVSFFVAGAVLGEVQVLTFRGPGAIRLVKFKCHFSWQAQYLVKFR